MQVLRDADWNDDAARGPDVKPTGAGTCRDDRPRRSRHRRCRAPDAPTRTDVHRADAGVPRAHRRAQSTPERVHHRDPRRGAGQRRPRPTRRSRGGDDRGPLHGIPVSLKDLVDQRGVPTTAGSRVIDPVPVGSATRRSRERCARPAPCSWARPTCTSSPSAPPATNRPSARCTTRTRSTIRQADRAVGPRSRSPPACRSRRSAPTRAARSGFPPPPAGSSASSPSVGEVSTDGVIPLSRTLDHAGPLARSVADAALVYAALVGAPAPAQMPVGGGGATARRARRLLRRAARARRARGVRTCVPRARSRRRPPRAGGPAARRGHCRRLPRHPVPRGGGLSCRAPSTSRGERYSPGIRARFEAARHVLGEDYVRAIDGRSRCFAPRSTTRSTGVRPWCFRPSPSWRP